MRVVAPHFVAGIVFSKAGICIEAAPILKWCLGKRAAEMKSYFDSKKWEAKRV